MEYTLRITILIVAGKKNGEIFMKRHHFIFVIVGLVLFCSWQRKIYYNLDDALDNPENVFELSLLFNREQLTSIPNAIGRLQNLRILELTGSQLTSLPKEIGRLQNLQGLFLNINRLSSLP